MRRGPPIQVPRDLPGVLDAGWARAAPTAGYLSEREARFLMLVVALAPAHGVTVEIGSFKGRSTVGAAYVARHYGVGPVVAIDPHVAPSTTDPDLAGASTSYDAFVANLARAGVTDAVEIHRAYSGDVVRGWSRPIRVLWIDGDHTYEGVRADVLLYKPYLAPGGVLVMHDVLTTFEGTLRVFVEDVLGSDDFGPVGFCGSIAWAQYRPADGRSLGYRLRRRLSAIPVRRLIPIAHRGRRIRAAADKYRYKFWRALAPHRAVRAVRFARAVAL